MKGRIAKRTVAVLATWVMAGVGSAHADIDALKQMTLSAFPKAQFDFQSQNAQNKDTVNMLVAIIPGLKSVGDAERARFAAAARKAGWRPVAGATAMGAQGLYEKGRCLLVGRPDLDPSDHKVKVIMQETCKK